MSGLFITSTGTEIGKTFVTAALCHQLRQAGKAVTAIKPVISGIEDGNMDGTDTAAIAGGLGLPLTSETVDMISPFRFKAPLAPVMAAKLEGRTLDYQAVVDVCKNRIAANTFTLVEGVGGSFVPMTEDKLVADWIADLGLPSLLVTGSYLGTISHTIATVDAMCQRNLPIGAIIISESAPVPGQDPHPDLQETAHQIEHWCGLPVATVPRIEGTAPWKRASNLLALVKVYP